MLVCQINPLNTAPQALEITFSAIAFEIPGTHITLNNTFWTPMLDLLFDSAVSDSFLGMGGGIQNLLI